MIGGPESASRMIRCQGGGECLMRGVKIFSRIQFLFGRSVMFSSARLHPPLRTYQERTRGFLRSGPWPVQQGQARPVV